MQDGGLNALDLGVQQHPILPADIEDGGLGALFFPAIGDLGALLFDPEVLLPPPPPRHPIFDDIYNDDLAAVQQRVLADATLLEERDLAEFGVTPLMFAIRSEKPAIALWLIEHRGQHDVGTVIGVGKSALYLSSRFGPLAVLQALVAAGASPASRGGYTPLIDASTNGHTDIVAFLLQLPATIDHIHISMHLNSALLSASRNGYQPIVQLLLDAGANPVWSTDADPGSPLNLAISNHHHDVAALLRQTIADADRGRALHKARCLLSATAPACLLLRQLRQEIMPQLELLTPPQQEEEKEKVRATVAFAMGVSGGEKDTGLCEELYLELLMYMLPAWVK